MNEAADRLLHRLLRLSQSRSLRNASEPASISMTLASCPDYAGLRTLEEFETFHAQIALAERAGGIRAERDRKGGDGSRLLRLVVSDVNALGRHLGVALLEQRARTAHVLLAPWQTRFPVIHAVLCAWSAGRRVRSRGPEAATDLADACRVASSRDDVERTERILRRESVHLFGDSKRLEKLVAWLELLATGELDASGLSKEDVWALFGLRREPRPLLLAGSAVLVLAQGELALIDPYLGIPPASLRSIRSDARYLLTIENLTSFHDAACAPHIHPHLLIYTAGMPSPAWRESYARILRALPLSVPIFHWGDVDEGGFRIAATLAAVAVDNGRHLLPWQMSPTHLSPEKVRGIEVPSQATLRQMLKWARNAGWDDVADALQDRPIRFEQEALDSVFPLAGALLAGST